MDYNIDINSTKYSKLTKKEKLELVNHKIGELISEKQSANTYGVQYNGKLVYVKKENAGKLKDLMQRQKCLKKYVSFFYQDFESDDLEVKPVEKSIETNENFEYSNLADVEINPNEYKNSTIEDKIAILNAKKDVFKRCINTIGDDNNKYQNAINIIDSMIVDLLYISAKKEIENKKIDTKEDQLDQEIKSTKKEIINLLELYKNDSYEDKHIIAINYNGERRYLPYSKIGEYKSLKAKLESLQREKREIERSNTNNAITKEPTINRIERNNNLRNDKNTDKDTTIKSEKEEKKKKKGLIAFLLGIPVISKIVNKIKDKKEKKNNDKKNHDNITDIQRKNKRNRVLAAIGAAGIIITSALGIKSCKNNTKNINNTSNKEGFSNVDNTREATASEVKTLEPTEEEIVKEEDIIIEGTDRNNNDSENKESFDLGQKVIINDNSDIYVSSYDATDEVNKLNPLYDGDYERTILGVVYELYGQIYTVYYFEEDANEKINCLEANNAKQTAVLVTRSDLLYTGQYEGYYNVDDVKVLTKTR